MANEFFRQDVEGLPFEPLEELDEAA
jgi:hypothetical protein